MLGPPPKIYLGRCFVSLTGQQQPKRDRDRQPQTDTQKHKQRVRGKPTLSLKGMRRSDVGFLSCFCLSGPLRKGPPHPGPKKRLRHHFANQNSLRAGRPPKYGFRNCRYRIVVSRTPPQVTPPIRDRTVSQTYFRQSDLASGREACEIRCLSLPWQSCLGKFLFRVCLRES